MRAIIIQKVFNQKYHKLHPFVLHEAAIFYFIDKIFHTRQAFTLVIKGRAMGKKSPPNHGGQWRVYGIITVSALHRFALPMWLK
ncbi:hypothetical protein ACF3NV_08095 [Moraxella atlantae]|uniref:hypothetical protein n=1 Tax=Faucicola atlantae TaxID=34059 RepID=UPI003750EAD7